MEQPNYLPIKQHLRLLGATSLVVALLLASTSAAGLLFQASVYPTEELQQSFIANDVVNLLVGMPILLGALALAWRGRLIGLLCWPGALFFVVYNAVAYVFALPPGWTFALNLLLLMLAVYTVVGLTASMDVAAVRERLAGGVPERLAGGVLVGLGLLFLLRQAGVLISAIASQMALPRTELAVLVADTLVIPAWIIGGVLLWQRHPLGYVVGAGLLFQASMLFIALLAFFMVQPFLVGGPFPLADFVVVLVMGLICFVPFGLFVRSIVKRS